MTIFKKFLSIPGLTLLALLLAVPVYAADVTVSLLADHVDVTMPDGLTVPMWGLQDTAAPLGSATVPGPTIRAVAGDNLIINLSSNLPEPTSLVINGQKPTESGALVPVWTDDAPGAAGSPRPAGNYTRRVRSFTHETVFGGGFVEYRWDGLKPGTYLIQSGSHQAVHCARTWTPQVASHRGC
jgi:FtsP/CotA-like multicopper oxidase with cupredoxin domain